MITTVIFDLDDTLYDEIDYCKSGFASVAGFLAGLPGAPAAESILDALWKQFSASNRTKTFNAALDELAIDYDNTLIQRLVQIYRTHIPKITLPSDSRNVLTRLSSKYSLALLTDGFMPAQKLKVRALGIEDYFKIIIYTEELGREFWKPSPAGFEKIIKSLNAEPQALAYVADNQMKDFIAPNNLGLATIRIIRPFSLHNAASPDPAAKAQHTIRQISELPALLQKL